MRKGSFLNYPLRELLNNAANKVTRKGEIIIIFTN